MNEYPKAIGPNGSILAKTADDEAAYEAQLRAARDAADLAALDAATTPDPPVTKRKKGDA
jgi:hypothetical protein